MQQVVLGYMLPVAAKSKPTFWLMINSPIEFATLSDENKPEAFSDFFNITPSNQFYILPQVGIHKLYSESLINAFTQGTS